MENNENKPKAFYQEYDPGCHCTYLDRTASALQQMFRLSKNKLPKMERI